MIQGQIEVHDVPDNASSEEIFFAAMQNICLTQVFQFAFNEVVDKQWLLTENPTAWQTLDRGLDTTIISTYDNLDIDAVLNNNLQVDCIVNILMINPSKRNINMMSTSLQKYSNCKITILQSQKENLGSHFLEIRQYLQKHVPDRNLQKSSL